MNDRDLDEALMLINEAEKHINSLAGDWGPSGLVNRLRDFMVRHGVNPAKLGGK